MTAPLIEGRGLSLAFGARHWPVRRDGFKALKDVSVEVWPGETVGSSEMKSSVRSTVGNERNAALRRCNSSGVSHIERANQTLRSVSFSNTFSQRTASSCLGCRLSRLWS